jgi:hypothetical protein
VPKRNANLHTEIGRVNKPLESKFSTIADFLKRINPKCWKKRHDIKQNDKQLNETKHNDSQVIELMCHRLRLYHRAGNTKGRSITVPLTSCLMGLESAV